MTNSLYFKTKIFLCVMMTCSMDASSFLSDCTDYISESFDQAPFQSTAATIIAGSAALTAYHIYKHRYYTKNLHYLSDEQLIEKASESIQMLKNEYIYCLQEFESDNKDDLFHRLREQSKLYLTGWILPYDRFNAKLSKDIDLLMKFIREMKIRTVHTDGDSKKFIEMQRACITIRNQLINITNALAQTNVVSNENNAFFGNILKGTAAFIGIAYIVLAAGFLINDIYEGRTCSRIYVRYYY